MHEVKDDITSAPRQSRIFELPIELGHPDELLERIIGWVGAGEPTKRVMYVNAHVLNQSREDPALRSALEDADLVYCDGYGVRLAAKALSAEIPHRMTGADWIWDLATLCEAATRRCTCSAASPASPARPASACAARTRSCASSARTTATSRSAPGHDERVIEDINRRKPDILLVGMGTPKQEIWAQRTVDRLDCSVLWSVGALFDFVSGRVPRAPASLSDNGLEWIFRLAIEPQRMWRRYLVGNPVFLSRVMAQARQRHDEPRCTRRAASACSPGWASPARASLALGLAQYAGVVGPRRRGGALHVALAIVVLFGIVGFGADAAAAARRRCAATRRCGSCRSAPSARALELALLAYALRPVRPRAGASCSPAASRSASSPGGATRACRSRARRRRRARRGGRSPCRSCSRCSSARSRCCRCSAAAS